MRVCWSLASQKTKCVGAKKKCEWVLLHYMATFVLQMLSQQLQQHLLLLLLSVTSHSFTPHRTEKTLGITMKSLLEWCRSVLHVLVLVTRSCWSLLCCRFLAGSSAVPPLSGQTLSLSPDLVDSFVPTPPPNLSKLISHHQGPRERKASPSSLPGRLSRALSLGTIPSLSRTGICQIARLRCRRRKSKLFGGVKRLWSSHFQILGSCLAEAGQPLCTRSLNLQVFGHYFVSLPLRSFDTLDLFLSQITFHWSREAVHRPQARLQLLQWLGLLHPVQVLPGGVPSSVPLVSTSAARSSVCFLQNRNPPSCLLQFLHHFFTPSRAPCTAAAFPTMYHLSKPTMVNTTEILNVLNI